MPGALGELGVAQDQAGRAERVRPDEPARGAQRLVRLGELARARLGVGERLVDPGQLLRRRVHGAAGLERVAVELRGVGEREALVRAVPRQPRVAPAARVVPGPREVHREDRRQLVGGRPGVGLQALAHPGVQAAPDGERQPGVGGVADDRAAEAQVAVAVVDEEPGQPPPRRAVGRLDEALEHVGEQRGWKLSPSTAARRTSARSASSSRSIRAIAAVSMESGSGASRSEAPARRRSRRNCGFPPERSATSRRTCGGSGSSSVTASASASASAWASGPGSISNTAAPGRRREARARVATGGDDEPRLAADLLGDAASRSAEAASM